MPLDDASGDSPDAMAARLARLRDLSGLDLAALSRLCGLSAAHLGMIVRRNIREPSMETVRQIARTTDVARGWILFGEGAEPAEAQVRAAVARAQQALASQHTASDFTGTEG